MGETIIMTEDEFFEKFTMRENHLVPGSGDKFETYGEEVAFVLRPENDGHVWTVADDGEGGLVIMSGVHLVNRLYYQISEESHGGQDIVCSFED